MGRDRWTELATNAPAAGEQRRRKGSAVARMRRLIKAAEASPGGIEAVLADPDRLEALAEAVDVAGAVRTWLEGEGIPQGDDEGTT